MGAGETPPADENKISSLVFTQTEKPLIKEGLFVYTTCPREISPLD
jgi:hypothetical protein